MTTRGVLLGFVLGLVSGALAISVWRSEPVSAAVEPGGLAEAPAASPEAELPELALELEHSHGEDEASARSAAASAEADPVYVVFGAVRDDAGALVLSDRADVSLVSEAGRRVQSGVGGGHYALASLEPGSWTAECRVHGFEPAVRALELRADAPRQRLDFLLERAWVLRVCVRDEAGGDLLAEVEQRGGLGRLALSAVATRAHPGERVPGVQGRYAGRYDVGRFEGPAGTSAQRFADLAAECVGRLVVDADPPVHVSLVARDRVLATELVAHRVDEVSFALSAELLRAQLAGVRLRLVDAATGDPLGGFWVGLGHAQMSSRRQADANGVVEVLDWVPGYAELTVRGVEYAVLKRELDLQPGVVTDLGDLALVAPVRLSGRIVTSAGDPYETTLHLNRYTPGDFSATMSRIAAHSLLAKGGEFGSGGLAPERYLLRISAGQSRSDPEGEWGLAPRLLDLRTSLEAFELVVERTRLVKLLPSEGALGMSFRVTTAAELPCSSGGFHDRSARELRLVPGGYVLELRSEGAVVSTGELHVGDEDLAIPIGP